MGGRGGTTANSPSVVVVAVDVEDLVSLDTEDTARNE